MSLKNKGLTLLKQNDCKEALACFNTCLKLDPECMEAWAGKGKTLYYQYKYNEALDCYSNALKLAPDNIELLLDKGKILGYVYDRYDLSIECYNKALVIEPENIDALYYKGLVLDKQGNYSEAIKCYDKILSLGSTKYTDPLLRKNKDLKALEK
jgi:tetratricopeptide (TPR) repeat protein